MTIAMSEQCRFDYRAAREGAGSADQDGPVLPGAPVSAVRSGTQPGGPVVPAGPSAPVARPVGDAAAVAPDVVASAMAPGSVPAGGTVGTTAGGTAEDQPCEVLRGIDGPVYFLRGGLLYVVHEVLGRWLEPERERSGRGRVPAQGTGGENADRVAPEAQVEHWLVTASLGRFGHPEVFRLKCRPAPPATGPTNWTVRPECGRRGH
jgi:hypothetical protein